MNIKKLVSIENLSEPYAWVGHLPFAKFLINALKPELLVELGTHTGNSYFAFCQMAKEIGYTSKFYAVDTWQGEKHAGHYSSDVYEEVVRINSQYKHFSTLKKMTFDEALADFDGESVDLLHIDGFHSYEAVKHDFDTWVGKVKKSGVILFHDISERREGFGVWQFWDELKGQYPTFEFHHSHGLGVLFLDEKVREVVEEAIKELVLQELNSRAFFDLAGQNVFKECDKKKLNSVITNKDELIFDLERHYGAMSLQRKSLECDKKKLNSVITNKDELIFDLERHYGAMSLQRKSLEIDVAGIKGRLATVKCQRAAVEAHLASSEQEKVKLHEYASNLIAERDDLRSIIVDRDQKLIQIYHSLSWQLTRPVRFIGRVTRMLKRVLPRLTIAKAALLIRLMKPQVYAIAASPSKTIGKFRSLVAVTRAAGIPGLFSTLQPADPCEIPLVEIQSIDLGAVDCFMQQLISMPKGFVKLDSAVDVVVIIPVYKGCEETARCIDSVLTSTNKVNYELIIINDSSPDVGMDELLVRYAKDHQQVQVLGNSENIGFVKTVNRGMELRNGKDIVLLNSDAAVANNWLDKLLAQAYTDKNIGSVTPFSNNATICNYPDLDGWCDLPEDETVASLDAAFAEANAGEMVDIPTAVGFCMLIKSACLDQVGLFDADAFGKGYGEENDFCLRASSMGWRHVLAADTFVFHEGEVSFSDGAAEKKNTAMGIIRQRYPDYEGVITRHIQKNSAYIYRVSATAARFRRSGKPTVLFVTHSLGGGTEKHIEQIGELLLSRGMNVLVLRSTLSGTANHVVLESMCDTDKLYVDLSSENINLLANVISMFDVSRAHLHHTMAFNFPIEKLFISLSVPYDVTVHDFYLMCPRVNLVRPSKGYCGGVPASDCNDCLQEAPVREGGIDAVWWRAKSLSLLNGAEKVICPSVDTADKIRKQFPSSPVVVVPHESITAGELKYPRVNRERKCVVLLGVLAEHKGLALVDRLLGEIDENKLSLDIVLIGYAEPELSNNSVNFEQTGSYEDRHLPSLIEKYDPDLILYPTQCPETYSYTLSVAIESGRPLLVSDIGSLPERVQDLPQGMTFPHDIGERELADMILEYVHSTSIGDKSTTVEN